MGYISTYPNGDIIGTKFPKNEMIESQFDIYNKYKEYFGYVFYIGKKRER